MAARGSWILLAMALVACPSGGGTTPGPANPAPGPPTVDGDPSPPVDVATPTGPTDPVAPPPGPVSRDECGRMIDKVIAIGLAEQHAREPRAPQATAEQQAAIRERLLAAAEPTCATMSRASWDCVMAAADRAAMAACDGDGTP